MILSEWARAWAISDTALADLRGRVLGLDGHVVPIGRGRSEAAVQAAVRVKASKLGMRVFRNNVGAVHDNETGTHLRFGLANDSPQLNAVCKSADLIGIRPRIVQPGDVGSLIGQFVSYECKYAGWSWSNTERERAQANWAALIVALGGEARFITDEGQI